MPTVIKAVLFGMKTVRLTMPLTKPVSMKMMYVIHIRNNWKKIWKMQKKKILKKKNSKLAEISV